MIVALQFCVRCRLATRTLEIGSGRPQTVRVVIEQAEAGVAFVTKKTAHHVTDMTVVDGEPAFGFLLANRTNAALALEKCIIFAPGNAVTTLDVVPRPGLVFLPLARVVLVLVSRPVGTIVGAPSLSGSGSADRFLAQRVWRETIVLPSASPVGENHSVSNRPAASSAEVQGGGALRSITLETAPAMRPGAPLDAGRRSSSDEEILGRD